MDAREEPRQPEAPRQSAVERYGLIQRKPRRDDARGDYKAFAGDLSTKDTLEAVELRGHHYETEVIYYSSILRFLAVADVSIVLHGADFQAVIEGEHLGELVSLLKRRKCDYLQALDAKRFREPPAEDESGEPVPVIRKVQVFNRYEFTPTGTSFTGSTEAGAA